MNDLKITKISFSGLIQDIGADVCKAMHPLRRHRYSMAVTYHLENGAEQPSIMRGKTKNQLKQLIIDYSDFASKGKLFALFDDMRGFIGTRLTF